MKTIVTHTSPDLDAVTSAWMVKRFIPGWKQAHIEFVQTGSTLNGELPDSKKNTIHVDTGFGMFDHHHTSEETCAAKKVYDYLVEKKFLKEGEITALGRIADVVTRYDHFKEVFLDEPNDDMYDFSIAYIVVGLRLKIQDDLQVFQISESLLDALLVNFKNKVNAESVLENGYEFKSWWGKTIAFESENDAAMKLAFKTDYDLAIRKSKMYDYVRVKLHPRRKRKLKKLHEILKEKDPEATWFYHPSGRMLLNGSSKKPNSKATKLSLVQVINAIKKS